SLCSYVLNNPVSATDPDGHWCLLGFGTTCTKAAPKAVPAAAAGTAVGTGEALGGGIDTAAILADMRALGDATRGSRRWHRGPSRREKAAKRRPAQFQRGRQFRRGESASGAFTPPASPPAKSGARPRPPRAPRGCERLSEHAGRAGRPRSSSGAAA